MTEYKGPIHREIELEKIAESLILETLWEEGTLSPKYLCQAVHVKGEIPFEITRRAIWALAARGQVELFTNEYSVRLQSKK